MTQAAAQSFDPAYRRTILGASELGAVMGVDRWKTPLDVFREKTGLTPPFEGNAHTERGKRLEHLAAELYTEKTGRKLQRRTQEFKHPEHPFIVGHIDRMFVGEKRIAEIKAPSIAAFRKYQREGLPDSMQIQMQVYLGLTGCPVGTWIIFCADAWQIEPFDIEFDRGIYEAAIGAGVRFWLDNVQQGVAPEPTKDEAKEALEIQKSGGTVTRRDDEAFRIVAETLREAKQLEADVKALNEIAKQQAKDAVEGVYGGYEGFGVRFYLSRKGGRTSFDKKALAADHPEIDLAKYTSTGSAFDEFRTYLLSTGD